MASDVANKPRGLTPDPSKLSLNSTPTTDLSDTETGDEDPTMTTTITTTTSEGKETFIRELESTTTIYHSGTSKVSHSVDRDGAVHLRPVPTARNGRVKVKKVITFEPRLSQFDRFNPAAQSDPFRGFYVLFWILIGAAAIRTFVRTYNESGYVVGMSFATLFSKDAKILALSDAVLVGSTFLCVPFIKLVQSGWIRYYWTGVIIQHIFQATFLGLAVREWPWVQSGFLTLHALAMLMKIHSYCATNGDLSYKQVLFKKTSEQMTKEIKERGGREDVLAKAREATAQGNEGKNGHANHDVPEPPTATNQQTDGVVRRRSTLHKRTSSTRSITSAPLNFTMDELELLHNHPDETIRHLAAKVSDLEEELASNGKEKVRWPRNVTYYNFWDYLLVPTLVYDLEYPRTNSIRPLYILEKTLATFGTFSLLYIVTEHYIIPFTPKHGTPLWMNLLDLCMPFMVNYLLIFYIIFECICNAFAEFTRFADRSFYEDWWNSTSFDEFSRRWNKPVHSFLLRHVYASTISAYKISKFQAAFVTFFLSALVHELVMAIVTKKIRMYLFLMQMAQLPMIMVGRAKFFKENPTLGNIVFWLGLLAGFPLLAVTYV